MSTMKPNQLRKDVDFLTEVRLLPYKREICNNKRVTLNFKNQTELMLYWKTFVISDKSFYNQGF